MHRAACCLLLACLGALVPGHAWADEAAAAKLQAESRAFVEVVVDPEEVVVGQVFLVRIRLGFDAAFFEAHGVAQFRQPMDVPLQVRAPWLRRIDGLAPIETRDDDATPLDVDEETRAFALGDAVVRGALVEGATRGGRQFDVIEVVRAFTAERAGTFTLTAPEIRFAYATAFEEDFLDERRPLDRHRALIEGTGTRVVAGAAEGDAPDTAHRAVGSFTLETQVSRTEVVEGDVIDVSIAIVGQGNPGEGLPPRPAAWTQAFDIIGHRVERRPGRQIHHYELAPRSTGNVELAAIEFTFLDPGPPSRSRGEVTRAIRIDVARSQVPAAVEAPPEPEAPITPVPGSGARDATPDGPPRGPTRPLDDVAPSEPSTSWSQVLPWLGLALLLALLTWLAVWLLRRDAPAGATPVSPPPAPRTTPTGRAQLAPQPVVLQQEALDGLGHSLRAASASGDVDAVTPALTRYLAARLRCRPGEVYDADLDARMAAAGMGPEAREAGTRLLRALTASRYGPIAAPASLAEDVAAILRDKPPS